MTSEHGVLHSFSSVREIIKTQQMVEPMGSWGLNTYTERHKLTKTHTSNHPRTCVNEALLFRHNFTSMDRSTVHTWIVIFEGRSQITIYSAGCIVVYVDINCLALIIQLAVWLYIVRPYALQKNIFLLSIFVLFPVEISKLSQIKIHLLQKQNYF